MFVAINYVATQNIMKKFNKAHLLHLEVEWRRQEWDKIKICEIYIWWEI